MGGGRWNFDFGQVHTGASQQRSLRKFRVSFRFEILKIASCTTTQDAILPILRSLKNTFPGLYGG